MTITITARARAFSNDCIRKHTFQIEGERVYVWDEVAGHFTRCHSLSVGQIARLRKLAKNQ